MFSTVFLTNDETLDWEKWIFVCLWKINIDTCFCLPELCVYMLFRTLLCPWHFLCIVQPTLWLTFKCFYFQIGCTLMFCALSPRLWNIIGVLTIALYQVKELNLITRLRVTFKLLHVLLSSKKFKSSGLSMQLAGSLALGFLIRMCKLWNVLL